MTTQARHLIRLDNGVTSYVANDKGAYLIDQALGTCTKAAHGFSYINITTGLIGIDKVLGTPRPMEYQVTDL